MPTDINPIDINYYPFMILDKCNKVEIVGDDLSTKVYIPSKTKDVNVKAFNTIM